MIVARGWGRANEWIGAVVAYGYGRLQLEYVLHGDRTQVFITAGEYAVLVSSGLQDSLVAGRGTDVAGLLGPLVVKTSSGARSTRVLDRKIMTAGTGRRQVTVTPGPMGVAEKTGKKDAEV